MQVIIKREFTIFNSWKFQVLQSNSQNKQVLKYLCVSLEI